jgi:hypothetical protein
MRLDDISKGKLVSLEPLNNFDLVRFIHKIYLKGWCNASLGMYYLDVVDFSKPSRPTVEDSYKALDDLLIAKQ